MKNEILEKALSQSDMIMLWIVLGVTVYITLINVLPVKCKLLLIDIMLWFFLSIALVNVFVPPVDADDEITAAILLVAYTIGQIGRILIKKLSKAET